MASLTSSEPSLDDPPTTGEGNFSMAVLSAALPTATAPTPKSMATIEDLPIEIMTMIIETMHRPRRRPWEGLYSRPILDDYDIFSIRCSSRRLELTTLDAFIRRFFKSRKYVLCQQGMQRMANLISNAKFGPHVKELAFRYECWKCSGTTCRCEECEKHGRRAHLYDESTPDLVLSVNMNSAMWLDTCSRMQVLSFNKSSSDLPWDLGRFETYWVENVLRNCQNLVELTLYNELKAGQILERVRGNSLLRLGFVFGCQVVFPALGAVLQRSANTLEEIEVVGVQLQCPQDCLNEDSDDYEDMFLSRTSMFELMLHMPRLQKVQLGGLTQMYHRRHEQHMRISESHIHPDAIGDIHCYTEDDTDVKTQLQFAVDHSYTVRIAEGGTSGGNEGFVQVRFPCTPLTL